MSLWLAHSTNPVPLQRHAVRFWWRASPFPWTLQPIAVGYICPVEGGVDCDKLRGCSTNTADFNTNAISVAHNIGDAILFYGNRPGRSGEVEAV